jgi:uncharacterized membrane protein
MHFLVILIAGVLSGFAFAFGYGLAIAAMRALFR